MPIYRRPSEIAGFRPCLRCPGRSLGRELTWAVALGVGLGVLLVGAGRDTVVLLEAVLLAAGIGLGGWLAEAIFFHHVGVRTPDPFSPGAYLARAAIWASVGGVCVWIGQGLAAGLTGSSFAGVPWFVGGGALTVMVQAPLRLRHRRREQRAVARARR